MTDQPENPDYPGVPQPTPPPGGPSPYPYAYPPGAPGAGPQHYPPGPYPGAYPPPPMPYGNYYPGAPLPPSPRNGLGVASLVVAIIAILGTCFLFGGLLGIVAIVLGVLGLQRVSRGEANNRGMAVTGIVLGAFAIILSALMLVFGFRVFNEYGGRDLITCVQDAGGDNDKVQQCMDEFQQRVDSGTGQGTIPG